uniref:Uncharacterized protein n=1 Tax=Acrobeloides nanus TaxID=290746 RepID=A0A914CAH1_9BILA
MEFRRSSDTSYPSWKTDNLPIEKKFRTTHGLETYEYYRKPKHPDEIADAKIARDLERLGHAISHTAKSAKNKLGEGIHKLKEKVIGPDSPRTSSRRSSS